MEAIPTPPTQRKDLTLRVAADLILCCVRTLRKEIARGRLRAFRVGNRIFIKRDDFATYLEEREIPVDPVEELQDASPPHPLKVCPLCEQNRASQASAISSPEPGMVEPLTNTPKDITSAVNPAVLPTTPTTVPDSKSE